MVSRIYFGAAGSLTTWVDSLVGSFACSLKNSEIIVVDLVGYDIGLVWLCIVVVFDVVVVGLLVGLFALSLKNS